MTTPQQLYTPLGRVARADTRREKSSAVSARAGKRLIGCSWLDTTWIFELFCALLSVVSLIVLVVVLQVYNGRPLKDWTLQVTASGSTTSISPNFVVSLLSLISKSSSAVVLSSGISQIKWSWFARARRPLQDLQIFDSASRGPRGSIELLWRTRAM